MPNKKVLFERPPAAPVFKPTLKEFEDPLDYIEKIRPVAQKYGICKIISPKQWNPPFAVDSHTFKFRPRVQRLNEIGAHSRIKNNFIRTLEAYWECQNDPLKIPVIKNNPVDLFELQNKVKEFGGCHQVTKNKQWTHICRELGYGEKSKQLCSTIRSCFEKLIQPYLDFYDNIFMNKNSELFVERIQPKTSKYKTALTIDSPKMTRSKSHIVQKPLSEYCKTCESSENQSSMVSCFECDCRYHINCVDPPLSDVPKTGWICKRCLQISCQRELARLDAEVFGFSQSNCKYSLDSFASYADNFKKTYFNDRKNVNMKEVEEEYWRLVAAENINDDVVVKYGADISSGLTSSGFPTKANKHMFNEKDQKYVESGWNLNNLPVLKKSIFRFVSNDISGMTVPWCYVGMVFSCFCWHIEDHWSYSINYLHTGECKTWYGVPESDADSFENLMRQEANELFEKSPDLLHHITTQINPTLLIKNNIKVYRTDQAAGEFVVTFPRAYHAGFNQGFNFAEAVNFCPADWLSKGRASVESYRLVKRPSVFSHNELICKMASSLDSLDLLLLKAVYDEMMIIQQEEKAHRKQICTMVQSVCRTERLLLDQIPEDDRECVICRTTLYISGVTCTMCCQDKLSDRMSCLDHVKQMCSCINKENIVLKYRYSLDEITLLVSNVHKQLEQYKLWMSRVYHLAKSEFCSSPVTAEEGRVMKNVSSFIENLDILREEFNNKNIEEKPNLEELKMLLQIGRNMNIPVYLLDFLEAIIETCQRAMLMTDQLLNSHKAIIKEENKENENNVKSESKLKKSQEMKCNKIVSSHEEQAEKLTLGEMRLLVEKLRSLPAHVPQLEEAAQTLHCINEWRKKVKTQVSSIDVIEEHHISSLIDSGESNLVYLSEYQMLQRMKVYTIWISKARQLFNSSDQSPPPSLDEFKKVRDEGIGLINTIEIDRIATLTETLELEDEDEPNDDYDESSDFRMTGWGILVDNLSKNEKQLSKIITDGDAMQKKAEDILKSTPGVFALFSLNSLLKTADAELKCTVPGIDRLKEVVNEAVIVNEGINEMWLKLQQCRRLVHIEEMQALIKQADSLCVAFDRLSDLKSLNRSIENWKKNLHCLFIKSNHNSHLTTPTLLEVLFPRPQRQFKLMIAREAVSSKLVDDCKSDSALKDSNVKDEPESCDDERQTDDQKSVKTNRHFRKSRGRQKRSSLAPDDPQIARLDNVVTFESYLKTGNIGELEFHSNYKNMCVNELEWMWNLRELNEDKASKDSSGHDFYCFCRKRGMDQKGAQVMCDLCQDWFHLACLGIQNKDMSKKKFLCPQCERSKRPPFEVILAEKRKLEQEAKMLKIPEHIGLCLMSQRVINFHKHTNQLFSPQTELGAAFAEYKRLFGVQAILPKFNQSGTPSQLEHSPIHDQVQDPSLLHLSTGKQSRKTPHSMAKSAVSNSNVASAPQVNMKSSPIPNKEALISIHRLKLSLSDDARRELEEIYIELCLLEVSQPTVTWIWKLYHSLIDNDEEEVQNQLGSENEICKRESRVEKSSENSENSDFEGEPLDMEYMRNILTQKRGKKEYKIPESEIRHEKHYIKRESGLFNSSEEKRDTFCKFSFKRKLAAKDLVQSTVSTGASNVSVKKQPVEKPIKSAPTRKRGRGGKVASRDIWDYPKNAAISSEYYDADNDMILLDKVVKSQEMKPKSKKIKGSANTSTGVEISRPTIDDTKPPSARQQRVTATNKFSKMSMSDKSDYSDEVAPSQKSLEIKPPVLTQSKRGRKPGSTANKESTGVAAMKRRRKGGVGGGPVTTGTGRISGGSKRICNDDCSADMCVQQSSEKVNWVACDSCDQWFHWLCVDIKSEMEIEQKFLCPRCKSSKKQKRLPIYKDEHYGDQKPVRERLPSLDDEMAEDMDGDDLNVTLDEEIPESQKPVLPPVLNRLKSCTSVDLLSPLCHHHHNNTTEDTNSIDTTTAFSMNLSPPSLFLQPECCVQEEVVEISYASRSDSDS